MHTAEVEFNVNDIPFTCSFNHSQFPSCCGMGTLSHLSLTYDSWSYNSDDVRELMDTDEFEEKFATSVQKEIERIMESQGWAKVIVTEAINLHHSAQRNWLTICEKIFGDKWLKGIAIRNPNEKYETVINTYELNHYYGFNLIDGEKPWSPTEKAIYDATLYRYTGEGYSEYREANMEEEEEEEDEYEDEDY